MINKLILDTLEDFLPTFYISKGNFKGSCVVFNYIEKPSSFADNEEDTISYEVLLNVYDKENIKQSSEEIIKRLNKKGFKKTIIQSALECNDGFFNMPIKLKIKLRKED